ncbi:MAG: serine/threonine-protein kinase [Pseudomarimonas sp.]
MSATPKASNSPLIPGYVIHKQLGQGGMATVYLATQEKLKREVALKVISPQHAMDEEFRDRFISEGQLTARLYHRHIMTVFDIGEAGGNFFMATEVLSGGTLDERLPKIHSVVDKLLILREVAEGLGFAHSHKIIHRDIKPGNILFRADGTAVVADFGIAKALDMTRAQTLAGMIVGTPSYMSPEQVQGQPLDGRSDLYSLGIMLYQMLTGELPFIAADPFAVAMAQIARNADPLPEHLRPLQPLLDSMIEKLPDRRVGSAAELCAAIDALLPTLDDAALSKGNASQRSSRPRTGTQRQVAVADDDAPPGASSWQRGLRWGGAVAAVLLVLVLGWWQWRPSPPATTTTDTQTSKLPTANMGADEAWLQLASEVRKRIDERRYFAPAGASAHDTLSLMLVERPTDSDAFELVEALCQAVAADATQLLQAGDRIQAGLLINQAKQHFSNHKAIIAVDARLRGESTTTMPEATPAETQDVDTLRQRAADALARNNITTPPRDNAVFHLRELLRLAPDDSAAQDQLRQIADDYTTAAKTWLERGNPGQANTAALRGLEALPGDPELMRLQEAARATEQP